MTGRQKVLVLGATGMLGNAVLRSFADSDHFDVAGTARSWGTARLLPEQVQDRVLVGVDVENPDSLMRAFNHARPDVVINCIGVVKQLADANDPLVALPLNAILPHRIARLCALVSARFVHISTDCVFSGRRGLYVEGDQPDATDLYGRSKLLGEVDAPHAITLRTSIIGHELAGAHGLVGWFLSQKQAVKGYRRAVFSGVPTVELARIIRDFVIPDGSLHGLHHVSAAPIDKFELLTLVGDVYDHRIGIAADDTLVIDRSLDSSRFRAATGYLPPSWPDLIRTMQRFG